LPLAKLESLIHNAALVPSFTCTTCNQAFDVQQTAIDKYPGWVPKQCMPCKKRGPGATAGATLGRPARPKTGKKKAYSGAGTEENLTVAEVLAKYTAGPQDGVFTDGAAHPNPGRGGWGAVFVRGGEIIAEACGHEPDTTNNRMELTALIKGLQLVPRGESAVVYTDSQLCVSTINDWAKGWQRAGWKRKGGPIKNLELVQELYALHLQRPELELRWIAAHSGNRWNEYADALATAYRRSQK
jgi:ribonuclease HI